MARGNSRRPGAGDWDDDAPRRGRPPREPESVPHFRPGGPRGPATTLTEAMIPLIATDLAQGASRAAAAASVSTTEDCLNQWLQRGKRDVAEGKATLYAQLLLECNRAARHFELYLLELGNQAAQDKALNVRWVTWRLGFLRPNEFTERAHVAGGTGGFALMSPDEAVATVHQLMADFLARSKAGGDGG